MFMPGNYMKKSKVKYYGIESDKIPSDTLPIRIVFISDLHNVSIGKHNKILLDKINRLAPDLVLLGGDTIVAKPGQSMDTGLRFIKDLSMQHQVYAANGNHEYRMRIYPEVYGTMYSRYQKQIEDSGVILLENTTANIFINNIPIAIHGLELDRKYYHRFEKSELPVKELKNHFGDPEDSAFHILLAHNPCYGGTYINWGSDLTLSGHYHGGIIRTLKNRPLIGNDFRLFPPYAYGCFRCGSHTMITSAGLGEHTIRLRINNPRELVVVDIRCSSTEG